MKPHDTRHKEFMKGPVIRPLPNEAAFKKAVDLVLDDTPNEPAIKSLVDMLLMTANAEDETAWNLAQAAARHAFSRSDAFDQEFRKFADAPGGFVGVADRFAVTIEQHFSAGRTIG